MGEVSTPSASKGFSSMASSGLVLRIQDSHDCRAVTLHYFVRCWSSSWKLIFVVILESDLRNQISR